MRETFSFFVVGVLAIFLVVAAGGVVLAQPATYPPEPLASSEWRPIEIRSEAFDNALASLQPMAR